MRKVQFSDGEYYHVYNRGVDKRTIFQDESDFLRFYVSLKLLNSDRDGLMEDWRDFKRWHPRAQLSEFLEQCQKGEKIVSILAYSLIPNHFHLILKQKKKDGIKKYMHKVSTSYTNYFNVKYDRSGSLFQGRFKASYIKSTGKLLYMTVYAGCNCEVHGISSVKKYPWCSFGEYISENGKSKLCDEKNIISDHFRNKNDFESFAKENIESAREKKEDEKILLE